MNAVVACWDCASCAIEFYTLEEHGTGPWENTCPACEQKLVADSILGMTSGEIVWRCEVVDNLRREREGLPPLTSWEKRRRLINYSLEGKT